MRWLRAALVTCLFAVSSQAETAFDSDSLMPFLADLANRGGYGVHYAERGAFLVRQSDGSIQCVLWPFSGEFHKISYTAPIPAGTVAIAHTHPRCCRDLSANDRREAERLRIPIIAVSMGTLHMTDGSQTARRGLRWSQFRDESKTCQPAGGLGEEPRPAVALGAN